ncbi:ABC transporter substrate-binding protein [Bacillus massiliglaciei]|uniref:ABC transporter substrate-binding protein n=1 Tax=Bacillus massiliglaciei TaxID=1816693 RepID=UPI000ABF1238|nr:ABC transporter substrate-binding protein [Bacillus massiliglaciei]
MTKMRKGIGLMVVVVALLLSACNGGSKSSTASSSGTGSGEINISLSADPPNLDPARSSALVDRQVQNSIFDKLFDLDPKGNIVPLLVDKYEVTEDGKEYTFHLKKDIKFQDGTDFNAEAVKFNLDRYRAEGTNRTSELQFVQDVEAVDPLTVKVKLSKTFSPFLSILTDRSGMMGSPAAIEKEGDQFGNNPVGTGPFVFEEHVKGDHVSLVKNKEYWNGEPKLDKVTFKIFTNGTSAVQNLKTGKLDFIDAVPIKEAKALENDPNFSLIAKSSMAYRGFYLNTTKAPLDNKYLREAVAEAVDRKAIAKVAFDNYAEPNNSPFYPGNLAYGDSGEFNQPDTKKVKELLKKGGKPNGFSFTMQIDTSPASETVGSVVQSMLEKQGIKVNLEKVEFGTLLDNADKGNFEGLMNGWSGRPDPDQSFYAFVVTGQSNNYSRISNKELDQLAEDARTEIDPEKRKQLYDQAMEIVHDEAGYVYLYSDFNRFGLSKKIKGFVYNSDGIIRTADLSKQ